MSGGTGLAGAGAGSRGTRVSDMGSFLGGDECMQAVEDGVDVAGVGGEVEDGVEIDASFKFGLGGDEVAERPLLLPGAPRGQLAAGVRLVAREAGLDEPEP